MKNIEFKIVYDITSEIVFRIQASSSEKAEQIAQSRIDKMDQAELIREANPFKAEYSMTKDMTLPSVSSLKKSMKHYNYSKEDISIFTAIYEQLKTEGLIEEVDMGCSAVVFRMADGRLLFFPNITEYVVLTGKKYPKDGDLLSQWYDYIGEQDETGEFILYTGEIRRAWGTQLQDFIKEVIKRTGEMRKGLAGFRGGKRVIGGIECYFKRGHTQNGWEVPYLTEDQLQSYLIRGKWTWGMRPEMITYAFADDSLIYINEDGAGKVVVIPSQTQFIDGRDTKVWCLADLGHAYEEIDQEEYRQSVRDLQIGVQYEIVEALHNSDFEEFEFESIRGQLTERDVLFLYATEVHGIRLMDMYDHLMNEETNPIER